MKGLVVCPVCKKGVVLANRRGKVVGCSNCEAPGSSVKKKLDQLKKEFACNES